MAVVKNWCETTGVPFAVSEVFAGGGEGGVALAEAVAAHAEKRSKLLTPLYDGTEPIPVKMEKVARAMYGASEVTWTKEAQRAVAQIDKLGFGALPLCIAKTQKSLSDDPQVVGRPEDIGITVRNVILAAGAEGATVS
jgi:formate--tetrahydrofolate ligase